MKGFISLLFTLFLLSCGNLSLDTDPLVVEAIDEGKIINIGDFFDISFSRSSDSVSVNPTSAHVKITYIDDTHNTEYLGLTIEPLEFNIDLKENPNPQFQITSDFQEGLYNIDVLVYENSTVISEYISEFIVYSGLLSGEVSTLYPLENIYTDSKIILESQIISDDSIDPYLIWTFNGEIITEGYESEGYNSIIWDTEGRYGFMDINLNLYPYKISNSLIESESSVDFSFIVNPIESELYDEDLLLHYNKLLYFNGNYIDEVDRTLDIDVFEESNPKVHNLFYGMEIGTNLGFKTKDSIIPVNKESGDLESFSIIINFQPLSLTDGSLLISQSGDFINKINLENGMIKHSFGTNSLKVVDLFKIDEINSSNLVISFVNTGRGYNLYYYNNGSLIKESEWLISKTVNSISGDSQFQVGGSGDIIGISAILGDIKVYFRDNSGFNNIYPDNLKDELGERAYSFINGFNSIYNPINFNGNGRSDGEYLYMNPTSYLEYMDFLPHSSDYVLNVNGVSNNYSISFYNDDGDIFQKEISGNTVIKKRGSSLFINNEMIDSWDSSKNSIKITANDSTVLDFITLEIMDRFVDKN